MKFKVIQKIVGFGFVLAFALLSFSCQSSETVKRERAKASTPREAYRLLYEAVKDKDTEGIKQLMSNNTMTFAGFAAEQQKQSLEKMFENGLTATTFADSLPETRDIRVNANFGAVEVWNEKDNRWDDLPFVLEDGGWKLAVGDAFKGEFKSPGKGQAQLEMEAGNPMNETVATPAPTNTNGKVPPKDKTKKSRVRMVEVPSEGNANQQ
jgi:hypothetical protein